MHCNSVSEFSRKQFGVNVLKETDLSQFWDLSIHNKRHAKLLKMLTKLAPNFNDLSKRYEKDKKRMIELKDWEAEDILLLCNALIY